MIVGRPVIISHGGMPPPSKTAQLKSLEQLETQLNIHRGIRAQLGHQTLRLLSVRAYIITNHDAGNRPGGDLAALAFLSRGQLRDVEGLHLQTQYTMAYFRLKQDVIYVLTRAKKRQLLLCIRGQW